MSNMSRFDQICFCRVWTERTAGALRCALLLHQTATCDSLVSAWNAPSASTTSLCSRRRSCCPAATMHSTSHASRRGHSSSCCTRPCGRDLTGRTSPVAQPSAFARCASGPTPQSSMSALMAPSSEGEGEGGTSKAGNDHSLAAKAESSIHWRDRR